MPIDPRYTTDYNQFTVTDQTAPPGINQRAWDSWTPSQRAQVLSSYQSRQTYDSVVQQHLPDGASLQDFVAWTQGPNASQPFPGLTQAQSDQMVNNIANQLGIRTTRHTGVEFAQEVGKRVALAVGVAYGGAAIAGAGGGAGGGAAIGFGSGFFTNSGSHSAVAIAGVQAPERQHRPKGSFQTTPAEESQ